MLFMCCPVECAKKSEASKCWVLMGRWTGRDILAGKVIRKTKHRFDNFDDYFSASSGIVLFIRCVVLLTVCLSVE